MYKLEMHLHTLGRSPCAQVDEKTIAKLYSDCGYDGIVCTNHYIRYLCESYYPQGTPQSKAEFWLDGYRTLKKECQRYGIDVFLGMELCIDSLTYYKPEPPHAELLIYGIDEQWLQQNPYLLFELTLPEVSRLCKQNGWILGQSHPFRTSVNVLEPQYLESAEIYNGHPRQPNRNELAEKFVTDNGLLPTAGSDFHFLGGEGSGVMLANPVHTNAQLVAELRKRTHTVIKHHLAAEAGNNS